MQPQQTTWTNKPDLWTGEFQGRGLDSDVSLIFTRLTAVGEGPRLHRHPYSETFILRKGTVEFSDGQRVFKATAGQIVVIPANTPHRFRSISGAVEMIDVHASPVFITTWLDEDGDPAEL